MAADRVIKPVIKWPLRAGMHALLDHRFRAGRSRMLFVVGHMRSGSSLLVHLLVNDPSILGFGETHWRYGGTSDFSRVAFRVLRSFGRFWPRERYILDKVLHAEKGLSAELLTWHGTRTILLARRPEQTLASILTLNHPRWATEEAAAAYYIERLDAIKRLASELGPDRSIFVTYEQLTSGAGPTLTALTRFLELSTPLTEEYKPLWSTGRPGIGDPSETIHSGRIIQKERREVAPVAEEILAAAGSAYDACVRHCTDELRSAHLPARGEPCPGTRLT